MNMKIHKGSTDCNCVGGANTCNGAMVCFPVNNGCGCGSYGGGCGGGCYGGGSYGCGGYGGGYGGGNYGCGCGNPCCPNPNPPGEVASETDTGPQTLCCGPVIFGGNTYESGSAVSHYPGSSDFIISEPGTYEVTYTVEISGILGNTATFQISGYASTAATAVVSQTGVGTVTHSAILTLKQYDILRLSVVPGTFSGGVEVVSAAIDIRKIN